MDIRHIGNWQVIRSHHEFLALEKEWQELFGKNLRHSPFQSWGWVTSWIRHLAGPHELNIVCCRDGQNKLLFILPLVAMSSRKMGGPSEYFAVCGYGPECSDHIGCLRSPEYERDLAEITASAIEKFVYSGARINLSSMDGNDDLPEKLGFRIGETGRAVRLEQDKCCPAVKLPGSWDEYLMSLSSNFRSQVRRYHRKITEHPSINFRSVEASEANHFASELIRLNRTRMADKTIVSSLENPEFRAFILEAVPKLARDGLAWLDIVADGDNIIGAALNLVYGDRVYYYMGGFDDGAGNLRPGTALFAEVIKRSIERGCTSYDFLRGAEPYKYRWGASDTYTWQLSVYPHGLWGRIVSSLDSLKARARTAVIRLRDKQN